jgi:hypothetical protein
MHDHTLIENLQDASRSAVREVGLRQHDRPVWGGPGSKVFLDSTDDFRRTIPYVEQNPVKAKQAPQEFGVRHTLR